MEEQIKDQSYYMIIPAHVWNADIKDKAKLLYGHITLLANKNGYCYASNKHLAKCVGVVKETASKLVSDLEKLGVIRSVLIYKDDSKEVEQRKIYLTTPQLIAINSDVNGPVNQIVNGPINQIVKDNTTSNNNTSNNIIDDDILGKIFFKIVELYPKNRIGNRQHGLKKFKTLDIKEAKLAAVNLKRYLKVAGPYVKNLQNYITEECFSESWLKAEETKSTTKSTTTKTFTQNYDNIS